MKRWYDVNLHLAKHSLCAMLGLLFCTVPVHAQLNLDLDWVLSVGSTDQSQRGDDDVAGIVIDEEGNVYVTGSFEGSADFNDDGEIDATGNGRDYFLVKYNQKGELIWFRHSNGQGSEYAYDVTIDEEDGLVYITGSFDGGIYFYGNDPVISNGSTDMFVAAYDAEDGNQRRIFSGGGEGADYGVGVVAAYGGPYVVGSFEGSADFDGDGEADVASSGSDDTFLVSYHDDGVLDFVKAFGGDIPGRNDIINDLAIYDGQLYVAGGFFGGIDCDGDGRRDIEGSSWTAHGYIAAFDLNGICEEIVSYEKPWLPYKINAERYGEKFYVTGSKVSQAGEYFVAWHAFVNLRSYNLSELPYYEYDRFGVSISINAAQEKLYVAGYDADSSGIFLARLDDISLEIEEDVRFGGGEAARGINSVVDIFTDEEGNVYVTGSFIESADFDGDGEADVTSSGPEDVFLAKYKYSPAPELPPAGILAKDFGGDLFIKDHDTREGVLRDGLTAASFNECTDRGNAVAAQEDGKLVVAGSVCAAGSSEDFGLVRYNPDGTLDRSFGTGGFVQKDLSEQFDRATDVAIQEDGKIVVVGYARDTSSPLVLYDFAVARFNPDGSPDRSFNQFGYATHDFGSSTVDRAFAVAVQPDGKIVLAGSVTTQYPTNVDLGLVRYNPDGTLDESFGQGGVLREDAAPFEAAEDVVVGEDGTIYAAGASGQLQAVTRDFALFRIPADGSSVSTATFEASGANRFDGASALVLQPDGKLVLAGSATVDDGRPATDDRQFALIRVGADGTLDQSFSQDGIVRTNFPKYGVATDVALQKDGKIVAAGVTGGRQAGTDFALARYSEDGSLDETFSSEGNRWPGRVFTDIGGADDRASALVIRDERIFVAGTAALGDADFALAAYETGLPAEVPTEALAVQESEQALEHTPGLPEALSVTGYPNPFAEAATLELALPASGPVEVTVYDVLGRVIERPLAEELQAGYHRVRLGASAWPSGVYLVRVVSGGEAQVTRLTHVR